MTDRYPHTSAAPPVSRGAQILDEEKLEVFLSDAYWATEQCGTLGGLVLVRVRRGGEPLNSEAFQQASYLIAQLARQADAVGAVDEETIAVVLRTLSRRDDLHLMIQRLEEFLRTSYSEWEVAMGMSLFPLCGPHPREVWESARRDLEGAISHDTWEHQIPRDTIRTRVVGR